MSSSGIQSPKLKISDKYEQAYDTVRIIANDGTVFEIPRKAALHCKVFQSAFGTESSFMESVKNEIKLDYNKTICKIITDFLVYKEEHNGDVSKFKLPKEYSIDLYAVSDFLGL